MNILNINDDDEIDDSRGSLLGWQRSDGGWETGREGGQTVNIHIGYHATSGVARGGRGDICPRAQG